MQSDKEHQLVADESNAGTMCLFQLAISVADLNVSFVLVLS